MGLDLSMSREQFRKLSGLQLPTRGSCLLEIGYRVAEISNWGIARVLIVVTAAAEPNREIQWCLQMISFSDPSFTSSFPF